jgi:vitamin B12 transporter
MNRSLLSRFAGRMGLAGALVASVSLRAQMPAEPGAPLPDYVVSATRSPQDPKLTPSAVTLVSLEDLALAQVGDLRQALAREPGVVVVTTGATGGPSSVFLRGASSHQTLFVVDGVRMSDRAASYTTFLGGADLAGLERIEVLRGPQSTLYGSSAMGGVILLDTTRGCAPTTGSLSAVAGSFETWGASAAVAGGTRTVGYSAAVARYETANDAPNNGFDQWSYAGRLEFAPQANLLFGATFRRVEADFEEIGSRFYPLPSRVGNISTLGTVYGQARLGETVRSRLTLARHERDYTYADAWFSSRMGNVRRIADWQNTWQVNEAVELVAGANHERSRHIIQDGRARDEVTAGYLSGTVRLPSAITLTGGLRHDRFDSFGDATTGRAGVSWLPLPTTKLRATYGTGFSAPGSDDRFGVPSWGQRPNPELQAEKSRGWDVGVDHAFRDGTLAVGATYFHNTFRNLFEWETVDWTTYEGRIVNRARARTEGLELALQLAPVHGLQTRLAYTYLEARDESNRTRLIRRPRHVLDAEVRTAPTTAWTLGVGARVVADRVEGGAAVEDFTTVRVFTSYAVRSDLLVKLRVENALDERYEEVLGYASLPRGAFGSIEWRF